MKILARVNLSLPWHGAGAELYLHSCLRWLAARGHDCEVLARSAPSATVVDDVVIGPPGRPSRAGPPDLILTHLDDTASAMAWASEQSAPLVAIFHNHRAPTIFGHTPANTDLAIWNSQWTYDAAGCPLRSFAKRDLILRPPIDGARDYALDDFAPHEARAGKITLINLQPEKGVRHAVQLAKRMPDRGFLFVVGAYGRQERVRLPNAEILEPVAWDQMRDTVYANTRLLLMPSEYESFGRCAIEAAHAGIPTLAHPTGGLVEALGLEGAGIFAHRDQLDEWERVIRCLDDQDNYRCHSEAARARAAQLDPTEGYLRLEAALQEVCS